MVVSVSFNTLVTADISKPGRYLGNELGAVHKPWAEAAVRWVLTYPEVYEVGASNLGHIILYSILNAQPRQLCDRAYLPATDLATKLKETGTPLFAVESQRSLTDFDILGFSLSYEPPIFLKCCPWRAFLSPGRSEIRPVRWMGPPAPGR